MFPQEGEDVPKRRFPGFTEPWEQRKLGELSEIVRGASPRPIQDPKWFDVNSEVGWLRISDVTEQNGRIYHLEQKISELGQEKTRVLREPHLLLSIAATVGKPVVNYVKTGVNDGFLIFMNPKFDREYMFQLLEMFRPMWAKYGQPGSQVNFNSDLVREQSISIPSLTEQEKLGQFFQSLDSLISLHQRKLDKLKKTKEAFLEEMFI
ncbi:type I restriction modification DNA specificity domain protein [Streptococcus ictaluri 707-05]|uniref:Type I restriction modification DNA specificity domain protein n=1 Tax=Streptococcus ictaluri 707-05 TaxID=764299 RepID=G5K540_9STRE|nr:type I restriction modification DNA specificity domain protein [Streptococcus ictaluri 707-05]